MSLNLGGLGRWELTIAFLRSVVVAHARWGGVGHVAGESDTCRASRAIALPAVDCFASSDGPDAGLPSLVVSTSVVLLSIPASAFSQLL